MKKTYVNPWCRFVSLNEEDIVCASPYEVNEKSAILRFSADGFDDNNSDKSKSRDGIWDE